MTTHHLLHHFAQVTEAPAAVTRLRQLVLDLAVRGKLVAQEPGDEPASELFDRIQKSKKQITDEGRLPKAQYEIPANWKWCCLAELSLKIHYGYTASANPSLQDVRLLRITDIQDNKVDWEAVPGCEISNDQVNQYLLVDGDILIARTGGTVGKSFLVKNMSVKAIFASYLIRVQGSPELLDRYLKLFLESPTYWKQLDAGSRGTGQPNVNGQTLGNMAVPLPPLAEQQRIVAKVDELMTLCDELAAAQREREARRDRLVAATLHRLTAATADDPTPFPARARFYFTHLPRLTTRPEHIQGLRQTILNLAVQGKLVPQEPHDEPASNLLAELRSAKDKLQDEENIRERKPVDRVGRSDLGFEIPDTWELPAFDDVLVMISGVTKGRNLAGQKTIELPYLRVANVQRGYLDLSMMKTILIPENELARYQLRMGDIIMTEGGDWDKLGRAAIWMDEIPNCIHQNHIFRVRIPLLDKLLPGWVITYVNSELGRAYFEDASKQTTNLASINMTQLRICPIPLPPLAEQQRIVARVDELLALCDELAANLDTVTATRRRLLEAALQEALVAAA